MSWAIWITGLPGSGKTTLARGVASALQARGIVARLLELDEIRRVLTPEPTYTDAERETVYRALAYMAKLLVDAGVPVIIDATAHRRAWRELARELIPLFAEVQLRCPLEICVEREGMRRHGRAPRGIYARARQAGATVPGVDVPYEEALCPELVLDTSALDLWTQVQEVLYLARRLARLASSNIVARSPGIRGRGVEPEPVIGRGTEEDGMRVKDFMTGSPISVPPSTPVADARELMGRHRVRHLLVLDGERLVGIVTDRDIRLNLPSPATSLSVWEINYLLAKLTVGEVMTKDVITMGPDRPVSDAVHLMLEHKIGGVPVLEAGRVVGIITETDLLRALPSVLGRVSA